MIYYASIALVHELCANLGFRISNILAFVMVPRLPEEDQVMHYKVVIDQIIASVDKLYCCWHLGDNRVGIQYSLSGGEILKFPQHMHKILSPTN